jgi:hypothetical protein
MYQIKIAGKEKINAEMVFVYSRKDLLIANVKIIS